MTMFPLCMTSQVYTYSANLKKFSWYFKVIDNAAKRGHETPYHIVDIFLVHLEHQDSTEIIPERASAKGLDAGSSKTTG